MMGRLKRAFSLFNFIGIWEYEDYQPKITLGRFTRPTGRAGKNTIWFKYYNYCLALGVLLYDLNMAKMAHGIMDQSLAVEWIRRQFPAAVVTPAEYCAPFDVVVNGRRIEIKSANFSSNRGAWSFNIHRHGKLDESQVDYYLFRLNLVDRPPEHMLFPAPIGLYVAYIYATNLDRCRAASCTDLIRTWDCDPRLPEWQRQRRNPPQELTDEQVNELVTRLKILKGSGTWKKLALEMKWPAQTLRQITSSPPFSRPGNLWLERVEAAELHAR